MDTSALYIHGKDGSAAEAEHYRGSFLTPMLGAFDTMERCMIEMGIPQETALWLFKEKHIGEDIQGGNKLELERDIRNKARENYLQFPYWIRVQLEFLV